MSTSLTVVETAEPCPRRLVRTSPPRSIWRRQRRPPARARPTGPTSGCSRRGATPGAFLRFLRPLRRWRPIWQPRPKARSPRPLAGASPRSGTRTSWRASPCRPTRKASRPPCAAFAGPSAAPGFARPPRWPARCSAWSPRHQTSWQGLRDRALLLIGFGGALRRSELVALNVADIEETETGLLVMIRGSKTDQEGAGATIAIARGDVACPATRCGSGWMRPVSKRGRSFARSTRPARWVLPAYLPIGRQHRQGLCRTRWLRRQRILRSFTAGWLSDIRGGQRRVNLQDDGCVSPQVGGDVAGICPRCRVVQGSCWRWIALKMRLPCPLFNQQRTLDERRSMSEMCTKRLMHRSNLGTFDSLRGAQHVVRFQCAAC